MSSDRDAFCYSTNDDTYYTAPSREAAVAELISTFESRSQGDEDFVGWVGEAVHGTHESVVEQTFDDVHAMLFDNAYEATDHADGYPHLTAEQKNELNKTVQGVVRDFLQKHVEPPRWFIPDNVSQVHIHIDEHGKGHVVPEDPTT
jgi:hypothetical protein